MQFDQLLSAVLVGGRWRLGIAGINSKIGMKGRRGLGEAISRREEVQSTMNQATC